MKFILSAMMAISAIYAQGQTVAQLSKITTYKNASEIHVILSMYGYTYTKAESVKFNKLTADALTFSKPYESGTDNVILYKEVGGKAFDIQYVTYIEANYMKMMTDLIKDPASKMIESKETDKGYTAMYSNQNCVYSFSVHNSQDYAGKIMYTLSISNQDR